MSWLCLLYTSAILNKKVLSGESGSVLFLNRHDPALGIGDLAPLHTCLLYTSCVDHVALVELQLHIAGHGLFQTVGKGVQRLAQRGEPLDVYKRQLTMSIFGGCETSRF